MVPPFGSIRAECVNGTCQSITFECWVSVCDVGAADLTLELAVLVGHLEELVLSDGTVGKIQIPFSG